jgi:hypothetical protein
MKNLLLLFAFAVTSTAVFGINRNPNSTKKLSKINSYHIGLQNVAITMPTKVLNGMPHIGVEVGFSVPLKKDAKKQRFTVGSDAGYFFQKGLQSGTYLKPNIAYHIPVTKKISVQTKVGTGLLVTKNLNNEFARNELGEYKKVSPYNAQAMISIGVQPNINVYNTKKYKCDAFVKYEFAAQTPFSAISKILPLTMLQFGIKINLKH